MYHHTVCLYPATDRTKVPYTDDERAAYMCTYTPIMLAHAYMKYSEYVLAPCIQATAAVHITTPDGLKLLYIAKHNSRTYLKKTCYDQDTPNHRKAMHISCHQPKAIAFIYYIYVIINYRITSN